jgi:hypothetical protein
MAFVKEIPSQEARERYGPLPNLYEGRLWVADYEREIFLWGGEAGNPYFDDLIEGLFRMRYGGQIFEICLLCREWRLPQEEGVHVLNWDTLAMLHPIPAMVEMHRDRVVNAMKEAITALGSDALTFGFSEKMIIRFGF